jgi:hypothetical protein
MSFCSFKAGIFKKTCKFITITLSLVECFLKFSEVSILNLKHTVLYLRKPCCSMFKEYPHSLFFI